MANEAAREFWTGSSAIKYPDSVNIAGREVYLPTALEIRGSVGGWMKERGWIKTPIVDLGAGSTSKLVFPTESVEQVYAVDWSEKLLNKGGVPKERWIVGDVSEVEFPKAMQDKMGLVFAGFLMRYLDPIVQDWLIHKSIKLLRPGGRLVLADIPSLNDESLAIAMGEVSVFDGRRLAKLMTEAGLTEVGSGEEFFLFDEKRELPESATIEWVCGKK